MVGRAQTVESFWEKVEKTDGCWMWKGTVIQQYGKVSFKHKYLAAHRVAYELEVGPIPEGLQIDHLCREKLCVNPAHLEPVTAAENMRRALPYRNRRLLTACTRAGHPYTEENTSVDSYGGRHCRACARDRSERQKAERKAAREAKR